MEKSGILDSTKSLENINNKRGCSIAGFGLLTHSKLTKKDKKFDQDQSEHRGSGKREQSLSPERKVDEIVKYAQTALNRWR